MKTKKIKGQKVYYDNALYIRTVSVAREEAVCAIGGRLATLIKVDNGWKVIEIHKA